MLDHNDVLHSRLKMAQLVARENNSIIPQESP